MDDDRQLFEDIIRGQEMRDEGIVAHDEQLRELEEQIREAYVKRGFAAIPMQERDILDEKANEAWEFHDEIATVSGRLEIFAHDDDDEIIALLSDVAVADEDGEIIRKAYTDAGEDIRYIVVEDARLRSDGVYIDVERDKEGKLSDVHAGYSFYHIDDEEELVQLFGRPLDLHAHGYDTPSAVEAGARLESQYPREFEILEAILTNGASLIERILIVEEAFRKQLEDKTFRMLIELYVNEALNLDMKLAYMALVRNDLVLIEDPDHQDASWKDVEVKGALPVSVAGPDIHFSSPKIQDNDKIESYIFGLSYNEDDEKPEMVGIPVRNIEQFLSTRTRGSLAQRAIEAMDIQIEQDLASVLANANEVKFGQIDLEKEDETPDYIRQLEYLEDALQAVYRLGEEYRYHTFAAAEDARKDAEILLEKVKEHLAGTIFFQDRHLVEVMGERVTKGNHKHYLEWNKETKTYWHGLDPENPAIELLPGEKAVGYTDALHAFFEPVPVSDSNEEIAYYVPVVAMGVHVADKAVLSNDVGPIFSQLISRDQVSVVFDNSTDIKFSFLEQYRANQEALSRARQVYGEDSPLMERISRLEQALANENSEDFTSLDPTIISRFGGDLARTVRRFGHPVQPAAAVLETMFADRNIRTASDVYTKDEEGRFVLDPERSQKLYGWKVIDIKPADSGEDVMVFVESPRDNEYRYISLGSLTQFQF